MLFVQEIQKGRTGIDIRGVRFTIIKKDENVVEKKGG